MLYFCNRGKYTPGSSRHISIGKNLLNNTYAIRQAETTDAVEQNDGAAIKHPTNRKI